MTRALVQRKLNLKIILMQGELKQSVFTTYVLRLRFRGFYSFSIGLGGGYSQVVFYFSILTLLMLMEVSMTCNTCPSYNTQRNIPT